MRTGALLLDALGTLLGLEPPAPRLRFQLEQRCGIRISEELAERAIAAEIAYYRAHLDEGRDTQSLADLRRRCAEVISGEIASEIGAALPALEELTEALLASLRFRRFADVLPALTECRSLGLRLVVVSNWDVSLHSVLDRLGAGRFLDAVVTSAEFGARKPAREIFDHALGLAGAEAAHAWHVGDSVQEDVAGAWAAGITPILISRGQSSGQPEVRTIASLQELPEIIRTRLGEVN